jgi:protein gp37
MGVMWNLWHGCHKYSAGCLNCYVYRSDEKYGKDASNIEKTKSFDLPLKTKRNKEYVIPSNTLIYTCFTSDFLLPEADQWRSEAWSIIKQRSDCDFLFLTKRITRLMEVLPNDWGLGYDNVIIGCTCENQTTADERLPYFIQAPIKHKLIVCEPLLSAIDLSSYLDSIEQVIVGGESGITARVCHYDWIINLQQQCLHAKVNFIFKQTGAKLLKDGKVYMIPRKAQHSQAKLAGLNLCFKTLKW